MLSAARDFTQNLFISRRRLILHPLTTSLASSFSTATATNKRVGTHKGSFHCDEALGCYMIRLTHKFSSAQIVRTRDNKVLETFDAVLDVGGVYDPSKDRYDHHHKGFEEVFGHGFSTKLSSAGLVYKHYGMEIIAKELKLDQGHPDVHCLFLAVYQSFMEAIDANDNGINKYDTDLPKTYVNNTNLSSRVRRLIWTGWIQINQQRRKTKLFTVQCLLRNVRYHARSWLPARSIVMECLVARENVDDSGEIMTLSKFCPWNLHLFELEEEMKINPLIKYVLYEDDRGKNWRVLVVAVSPDMFDCRKPLPAHWRGLRDEELSRVSGIPGSVFIHMSGFIGGNATYEGALAMTRASLTLQ